MTPLGARRGFVVFVTVLFAVLAVAEAGAVALSAALDDPAGPRLTALAGLGALAFATLAVMYARQWRRMGRPATRRPDRSGSWRGVRRAEPEWSDGAAPVDEPR